MDRRDRATDYEVTVLKDGEMVPVATTAATSYIFSGLMQDSLYYVSVRARLTGSPGRRALALSRKPNSGTCAGSISDQDLLVESILSPVFFGKKKYVHTAGRKYIDQNQD